MSEHSPYEEGDEAYFTGSRNPYTTGTREYNDWNRGWADTDYDEMEYEEEEDEDEDEVDEDDNEDEGEEDEDEDDDWDDDW